MTAEEFATTGILAAEAAHILQALEAATPLGDTPDEVPSTGAQDCWICADVSIRILVDTSYRAGPAIEYALEPVVSSVSQKLLGVSQVGSGDLEETQIAMVLAHPSVNGAVDAVRSAVDYLRGRPAPTEGDLVAVRERVAAIAP